MDKFTIKGKQKWNDLPFLTVWASKFAISPKGTQIIKSLWNSWNIIKKNFSTSFDIKKIGGIFRIDSIWWPMLSFPQVDVQDEDEALKLHKMGIKTWNDLWDHDLRSWKSRASLIGEFNLSYPQLDLLDKRRRLWPKDEWWLLTIVDHLNPQALEWKDKMPLWPMPNFESAYPIHCVLNEKWKVNKDRHQWYTVLNALWEKQVEPKKACLAWLIAYRAI